MQEREHRLELLMMDKSYLSREVESLNERLALCSEQRDSAHAQLADANAQHESLCQRLLNVRIGSCYIYRRNKTLGIASQCAAASSSATSCLCAACHANSLRMQSEDGGKEAVQRRIEEEVHRIREHARVDLAAVRDESKAALDRETHILRDMRDHAQLEADRAKAELKDCKAELEDVLLKYRALQRKADVDGTALAAELKMRTADESRAQVCITANLHHSTFTCSQ